MLTCDEIIKRLEEKDTTLETIKLNYLEDHQLGKLFLLLPDSNVKILKLTNIKWPYRSNIPFKLPLSLEELELDQTMILLYDTQIEGFAASLQQSKSLRILNISEYIQPSHFTKLAEGIKNNTSLEELSLTPLARYDGFKQIELLVEALKTHPSIKKLKLYGDGHYATGPQIIEKLMILKNTPIEDLYLDQVGNNAAIKLADSLGEKSVLSKTLRTLHVAEYRMGLEGTEKLMTLWLYRLDLTIKGLTNHVQTVLVSEGYKKVVEDFLAGKAPESITMLDDVTTNNKIWHIHNIFKKFNMPVPPFVPELPSSETPLTEHKLFGPNIIKMITGLENKGGGYATQVETITVGTHQDVHDDDPSS